LPSPAKTSAPGTGNAKASGGKAVGAGGGKGKKGTGKKGKRRKKKQMKCGESGSYGDLKKKTGKGKFDRDHVPSKGALKEKAKQLNGGQKLCEAQKKAVDAIGNAIAIPKRIHQQYSPTYGQSQSQAASDAKNLQASAKRDTREVKKRIKGKECKKKYAAWARKINKITNASYSRMLKKAIAAGK
jgi:hypothetical protein